MSLKKTIKINPELFSFSGGNKTQKNRERKQRHVKAPLINPNSIKKQLLNRIKEHKNNENKQQKPNTNKQHGGKEEDIGAFTDEFMESIQYLTSLSKEKKEIETKEKYDKIMNEKRENLFRKTVKNPLSYNQNINSYNANNNTNNNANTYGGSPMPYVSLELPEELRENPLVPITNIVPVATAPEIKINTAPQQDVPYGCLKGGTKPTYRTWNSTRKNYESQLSEPKRASFSDLQQPLNEIVIDSKPSYELTDREKRLKNLQEKMKLQKEAAQTEKLLMSQNVLTQSIAPITTSPTEPINSDISSSELKELIDEYINEPPKMIKKTIKRKYTLGKSAIKKKVGILIKDKQTRKNVINAHKELKRKSLSDVKNYLKDKGLIKAGSVAPNDVIRKIYEASMLAGDITNKNEDVLLHNFLSETGSTM